MAPTTGAAMHRLPLAVAFRRVTPACTRPKHPNTRSEQSVIKFRPSRIADLPGQRATDQRAIGFIGHRNALRALRAQSPSADICHIALIAASSPVRSPHRSTASILNLATPPDAERCRRKGFVHAPASPTLRLTACYAHWADASSVRSRRSRSRHLANRSRSS